MKPVNYNLIHQWVRYHYGKASKCENEKCEDKSKNFEWALKKGKRYIKNRRNFIQMCVSCHRKYDITDKIRKLMRKSNYRTHQTHCKNGHLLKGENLYVYIPLGKENEARACKTCKRISLNKWRKRKEARENQNQD